MIHVASVRNRDQRDREQRARNAGYNFCAEETTSDTIRVAGIAITTD